MSRIKGTLACMPLVAALAVSGCDEKECVSANDCPVGRACVSERCVSVDDATVDVDRGGEPGMDRGVDPDQGIDPSNDQGIDPRNDQGIDPRNDQGIEPDADVGPACVPAPERCDGLDDDCDDRVDEDAPGYPCQPYVLTGGRIAWTAGTSTSANPAHPYRLEGRGRVTGGTTLGGAAPGGQAYELREGDFKWVDGIQSTSNAPGVP